MYLAVIVRFPAWQALLLGTLFVVPALIGAHVSERRRRRYHDR